MVVPGETLSSGREIWGKLCQALSWPWYWGKTYLKIHLYGNTILSLLCFSFNRNTRYNINFLLLATGCDSRRITGASCGRAHNVNMFVTRRRGNGRGRWWAKRTTMTRERWCRHLWSLSQVKLGYNLGVVNRIFESVSTSGGGQERIAEDYIWGGLAGCAGRRLDSGHERCFWRARRVHNRKSHKKFQHPQTTWSVIRLHSKSSVVIPVPKYSKLTESKFIFEPEKTYMILVVYNGGNVRELNRIPWFSAPKLSEANPVAPLLLLCNSRNL